MEHLSFLPVLLAVLPVFLLLSAQILLTLRGKSLLWQLLPSGISILGTVLLMAFLPEAVPGIVRILLVLYLVLLLIMCGIGWVIAYSIKKSKR